MSKPEIQIYSDNATDYLTRNNSRMMQLGNATMNMVGYFMDLGDDQPTAEGKVTELSQEIAASNGSAKFDYTLGDKQPLKDAVQASALAHMDQPAKDYLLNQL